MRLLTAPFGFGMGDSVTLRTSGPVDPDALAAVLASYSCYPPAIPKIVACLAASGRYDCVLQLAWFRAQERAVKRDLAKIGVGLECTYRAPTGRFKPLDRALEV